MLGRVGTTFVYRPRSPLRNPKPSDGAWSSRIDRIRTRTDRMLNSTMRGVLQHTTCGNPTVSQSAANAVVTYANHFDRDLRRTRSKANAIQWTIALGRRRALLRAFDADKELFLAKTREKAAYRPALWTWRYRLESSDRRLASCCFADAKDS